MKTEQRDFHQLSLYIGLDVHKKQWSVSVYTPTAHHRTFSQPPTPKALKNYLDHHFPGAQVVCAYEACKFGYWIQRNLPRLVTDGWLSIQPIFLPPKRNHRRRPIPGTARKIGKALRAGLLNSIYIPQPRTEGDRHLCRYRKKLWADLVRIKNRIKVKLLFTDISVPPKHDNSDWAKAFLLWLKRVKLPNEQTRLTVDLLLEQYHYLSTFPESIRRGQS